MGFEYGSVRSLSLTKPLMADREDVLQNSLAKGLTKYELLRDDEKLKLWITRILINECYNTLRGAVMALPEKKRIALTLHLEGYRSEALARHGPGNGQHGLIAHFPFKPHHFQFHVFLQAQIN